MTSSLTSGNRTGHDNIECRTRSVDGSFFSLVSVRTSVASRNAFVDGRVPFRSSRPPASLESRVPRRSASTATRLLGETELRRHRPLLTCGAPFARISPCNDVVRCRRRRRRHPSDFCIDHGGCRCRRRRRYLLHCVRSSYRTTIVFVVVVIAITAVGSPATASCERDSLNRGQSGFRLKARFPSSTPNRVDGCGTQTS